MALLTQPELEALLGRPLTTTEVTNLGTYLDIAQSNVEDMLCQTLVDQSIDGTTATAKTFTKRQEFRTVFTPVFTSITSVVVDGSTVDATEYTKSFWDNVNGSYYNSVVFDDLTRDDQEVVVTAVWGFATLPGDLKRLVAQSFATTSSAYSTKQVKSKSIEDFRIEYGALTDDEQFATANARVISKYGLCGVTDIQSGYRC